MSTFSNQRYRSSAAEKESKKNQIRQTLTCDNVKKQKTAIREILCDMSKGDDYSSFYVDVIKMMSTSDMELKKLLCLFLVSQSQEHHDKAHFLVNSLQQDAKSADPLTRALAVKTMGGIRSPSVISNFVSDLVTRVSTDDDPYVRKCAVLCVAKFYATDPQLIETSGLITHTEKCLDDSNPMVICNTIIALTEMSQMAGRSLFPKATSDLVRKLCTLMIETTEWGKVVILDFFATLDIGSQEDAERIIEDIQKCLQNTNSAVVLSAIKVTVIICMKFESLKIKYLPKIVSNLVGLLHTGPEMLYLILRNINLIVQEFPDLLSNDVNSFITSSNEPHCVRMEKIDIMTRLVTPSNIDTVLAELNTYAQEADTDIVKKAIISIGKCAVKVPEKAPNCVTTILGFIEKDPVNTVEASIIVMKDIFRQYPGEFPIVVKMFVENINSIQDSEAKAALVWFLGEYPDSFEDLTSDFQAFFLEDFLHEPHEVQLQILTAAVKIYLSDPAANKTILEGLMNKINEKCQNPDLRDRSYMYWRLISSSDPATVKKIVCGRNPRLDCQTDGLDSNLRKDLIKQMCTLASVYHKSPHTFIGELDGMTSSNAPKYESSAMDDGYDASQEPIGQEELFDENRQFGDQRFASHPMDYNQFSHNFASATDDINSGFSSLNLGSGSVPFGVSNPLSQTSTFSQAPGSGFGQESFTTSSNIMFEGTGASQFGSSLPISTPSYQPLSSSPETGGLFGTFSSNASSGGAPSFTGFPTSSEWGDSNFQSSSLYDSVTTPFGAGSSTFGTADQSSIYSEPLNAFAPGFSTGMGSNFSQTSSFAASSASSDIYSSPAFPSVNPLTLHATFVKKEDFYYHLSVKMTWNRPGMLKNISLRLRPNAINLCVQSTATFGSTAPIGFSCGDIPSNIEKEFIVPLSASRSMNSALAPADVNMAVNIVVIDCIYGSGSSNECTSLPITIPLKSLVSSVSFQQGWDHLQPSFGVTMPMCKLTSSPDVAKMTLTNNGFKLHASSSAQAIRFGAILINEVSVGVEIRPGMSTTCLVFSSDPSLNNALTQTLASL